MSGAKKVVGDKLRFGVVAAGNIAQTAFMPAVEQTGNSEITALVTGDPEKYREVSDKYKLKSYRYEEFEKLLSEDVVDAFYIATPNFLHRKFAEPALKAGYHVLLEKPMATSVEDCEAIIEASKQSGAKLMIGYRLHFEPATLELQNRCRSGDLGDLLFFSSVFVLPMNPENHRAKHDFWTGPVPDTGIYAINASRNIFCSEPIEVYATGIKTPGSKLEGDFHDVVNVSLKYPNEHLASFTVSFVGETFEKYQVVGTRGVAEMSPCYTFFPGTKLRYTITIDGKEEVKQHRDTDQFSGEIQYFSECVIQDLEIECDGEEGLLDVRVIDAIAKSLNTGQKQILEPRHRNKKTMLSQMREYPATIPPKDTVGRNSDPPLDQ